MVLKIRLARVAGPGGSKRHAPFYNIVLAQARSARDSKPLEVLGTYDPIPKRSIDAQPSSPAQKAIQIDVSRAKYWLGVGAQPSDTAWRLLSMIGLLQPRWLPNGQQTPTQEALRDVRFRTHLPPDSELIDLLEDYSDSQHSPVGQQRAQEAELQIEKEDAQVVKAMKVRAQSLGKDVQTTEDKLPADTIST